MAEKNASLAALLAGSSQAGMFHFCLTSSSLVVERFKLPLERSSVFIGDTVACTGFWNLLGFTLALSLSFCGWKAGTYMVPVFYAITTIAAVLHLRISVICSRWKFMAFSIILLTILIIIAVLNALEKGHFLLLSLSAIASLGKCAMIFAVVITTHSGHGHDGIRKYHFWMCASALFSGFENSLTLKVAGVDATNVILGMELIGLLAPLLHWAFPLIGMFTCATGINGCVLYSHLIAIVMLSLAAMASWIAHIFSKKETFELDIISFREPSDAFSRSISPFFMGILGMGMVFLVYPVIFPFMICHPSKFQLMMLLSSIVGSLAISVPWMLCGSSIVFTGRNMVFTKFNNWKMSSYGNTWFIAFPLILLFCIMTCCIHYPGSYLSKRVFQCWPGLMCGLSSLFLAQLFRGIGFMGVFANAIGPNIESAEITCILSGTVEIKDGSVVPKDFKIAEYSLQIDFGNYKLEVPSGSEPRISGTPRVKFGGIVAKVVETEETLGDSTNVPTGSVSISTENSNEITIRSLELTLSKTSKPIGRAKEIDVLSGIRIRQLVLKHKGPGSLKINNEQVSSATLKFDITLTNPIEKNEEGTFSLNTTRCNVSATLSGGSKTATCQLSSVSISGTVTVEPDGKIKIHKLTFSESGSLTLTFESETKLEGKTILIDSVLRPKFALFGKNKPNETAIHIAQAAETEEIRGEKIVDCPMQTTTAGESSLLQNEGEIVLAEQNAGKKKAGTFTSSTKYDILTSVTVEGLQLDVTGGKYFSIDGYVEKGDEVEIEFIQQNGALIYGSEKGFSLETIELLGEYDVQCNPHDISHGVTIGNCCINLSLVHMTVMSFTTQAYSVGVASFKSAKKSDMDWPTQGFGAFRSFFWWLCYGFKNGNRRFWSLGSVDIAFEI